jgi:hypothetical protein
MPSAFYILIGCAIPAAEADSVALRVESFLVPPSTGPVVYARVKNNSQTTQKAAVSLTGPEEWKIGPNHREVELAPNETRRIPFTIAVGKTVEANRYDMTLTAIVGEKAIAKRQTVSVASAPYFKPTIDGKLDDWKDAIPATFETKGEATTISTYWNRRQFSLLIAVEEEELIPQAPGEDPAPFDAVQFALAAGGAKTGTSPDALTNRYEFLIAAQNDGTAAVYQLAQPGMKLGDTQTPQQLKPYEDATATVWHIDGVTYYECSLSFRPMRDDLQPSEGREICFSVLVHDPDGTGLRDWGSAIGLWPSQRNKLAWSSWPGAKWPETPPFDSQTEWGLCTSKY